MRSSGSRGWTAAVLILLSAVGFVALLAATRSGVGLSTDSVSYVRMARQVLDGEGYSIRYFPPLFSVSLAAIGLFGVDPVDAARWLNALLFSGLVLSIGAMLFRHAHYPVAISIAGAVAVVASRPLVAIHVMAWSEPLFLCLGFLGLWLLIEHLETPRRRLLLAGAGAVSLAFLTRYAGAALVGAGMLSILALGRQTLRRRAMDASLFGALSCLPMALWVLRNTALKGAPMDRGMSFHPVTPEHWRGALSTASSWILPGLKLPADLSSMVVLAALVPAAALTAWVLASPRRDLPPAAGLRAAGCLACFAGCFCVLMLASVSFFDAHIRFSFRTLAPLHLALKCIALLVADRLLLRVRGKKAWGLALASAFAVYAGLSFKAAAHRVYGGYKLGGSGYASEAWRSSETLREVAALPPDASIFSNTPEAIYIHTGRSASILPRQVIPATRRPNDAFAEEMARMRRRLEQDGGFIVLLPALRRDYLPSESELMELLPLRVRSRLTDGAIYTLSSLQSETSPQDSPEPPTVDRGRP